MLHRSKDKLILELTNVKVDNLLNLIVTALAITAKYCKTNINPDYIAGQTWSTVISERTRFVSSYSTRRHPGRTPFTIHQ